jgi:hypothetical protein
MIADCGLVDWWIGGLTIDDWRLAGIDTGHRQAAIDNRQSPMPIHNPQSTISTVYV